MRYRAILVGWIMLLWGTACGTSPTLEEQTLAFSRVVDLSHPLSADMPQPMDTPRTRLMLPGISGASEELQLDLRSATYLSLFTTDAGELTVEQMSPRELIIPAIVLDVRSQAQASPDYRLSVAAIRRWERQHGRIPADCMVLLLTGWGYHWEQPAAYLNLDSEQMPQVPGFGAAAIEFLTQRRRVSGLGLDTPTVAHPPAVPSADIDLLLLENLTQLEQLPPTGATLVLGGLKLQAGTGSPVSVLAFTP
jgi:kynurenine formamidase